MKVKWQILSEVGVVLQNAKEVIVSKNRIPIGVYITKLNDRCWWTFRSQEEVDGYIDSCRIVNVEKVTSIDELNVLRMKNQVYKMH